MKRNTVLILGAGASQPFGFPTGGELKGTILKELSKPTASQLGADLLHIGHSEAELVAFRERFRLSQVPTIDAFIQGNEHLERLGKHIIAAILLKQEADNRDVLFDKPDWYNELYLAIKDDPKLCREHLGIVTFNYDRSLEYYLQTALENATTLLATEVEAKVEGLKILHFYGHLGSLKGCEKEGRKYCKYDLENIPKAAETIHLIQRDIKTNEATEMAARMCRDAEVIAFLGFGFHPENIRALRPDLWKHESEPLEVYATSKGLPQLVQRAAQNIIRQKIEWHNSAFDVCAFVRNVPILVDV